MIISELPMSDPLIFTVSKADPAGKEPTPGAILHITADLGQVRETLPHAVWRAANLNIHMMDAQQVVAALAHLPQGTIDQVLVLLLQQRASLLRVAGPFPCTLSIAGLPEAPPEVFRSAVEAAVEEIRTDERITPEGAARTIWFAFRHLVPAHGTDASPVRCRSEADDAHELDWLRGYLNRDPSCPAREVREEIVRKLSATGRGGR